ncbi:MAG TPA: LptE family protein [Acidobacteriaceae bacterium]|nr:LptE family protein [Acidobacteriaceae bacterium]
MSLRFPALAAAALVALTGCNYHTVNSAVHLPSTVHTLAVPSFQNHTQSYHTQAVFTQAVIREFANRTPYHIVAGEDADADATLNGTITRFDIIPLTYDNITGQTSSYLVTIIASVEVKDRDGRVLYNNPSYLFRQQYEQTQDLASFIQEDSAATRRLAAEFASAVVADIVESF